MSEYYDNPEAKNIVLT